MDKAVKQIWDGVTPEEISAIVDAALESLIEKQKANRACSEREVKTHEPGSSDAKAEEYYLRQAGRELFYLETLQKARGKGRANQSFDHCAAILITPERRASLPPELVEPRDESDIELE